jgi:alkaline phosphatase D
MKSLLAKLFFLLILFVSCTREPSQPYVVMLSLDGFRWDYAEHANTPNLDYIAASGIKARSLIPSFPTKTFPNHYTMATGLYPDHHGIVQNSFYDPNLDRYYQISDRSAVEDGTFYGGEPIWVTAEKQGLTSASFFWVGSEAPVQGIQPTYWKKYKHDFPFEQRIDTVIRWLSLPEDRRPHLILWYMDEPDGIGHTFGPDHEETYRKVQYLDSLVGVFLKKLNELPHAEEINIIVTSDHGMGPIDPEKTIFLDEYLNEEWFETVQGHSPNLTLKAKPEFYDAAWTTLSMIPHVQVWKHGTMPERLHYGTHARTLDFILLADSAWQFVSGDRSPYSGGAHGYDNANTDMHAIFYAMGPAINKDPDFPSFYNVDIYVLLTKMLDLTPAPTDGDPERVIGILKNDQQ